MVAKSNQASRVARLEWEFLEDLFEPAEIVLVGVSGGADSMVLLELLTKLAQKKDFELQALHVNYGLRGRESQLDEQLVRYRCKQLNVFLNLHKVNNLSMADSNLEERAREVRQRALTQTAEEIKATGIALGHTLDDQAETILMRLLRGSGLTGLKGMSQRDGQIVRPLLKVTRLQVRTYARERGIPYRDDSSNVDLRFMRNKIRHQLLPLLKEQFNPQLSQVLVTCSELIADDEQFMSEMTKVMYRRFVKEDSGQGRAVRKLTISSADLMELPRALQRRVLRMMIGLVGRGRIKLGYVKALEQARKSLAQHRAGVKFPLGGGLTLRRSKGIISISFDKQ